MSYPTGMGLATGAHYNNVANQMQNYLNNNNSSPHLQPASGHVHQHHHSRAPAFASHGYPTGGSVLGFDPVIMNDVGGFARTFMHNLLR
jgi:hypothetical protein